MATCQVQYICGHTITEELRGSRKDREQRMSWARKTRLCPECSRIKREDDRAAATEMARLRARATGLPELVGSPQQTAWAERIRAEALASPHNDPEYVVVNAPLLSRGALHSAVSGKTVAAASAREDELMDAAMGALAELHQEGAASWWIDRRAEVSKWVKTRVIATLRGTRS